MLNSTEFFLSCSIVGIWTFISMMNTTSARDFFICCYFSFYEKLKFRAQLSWAWKKLYNLGACNLTDYTNGA